MADRYVISRNYGKCLEGWLAARKALECALRACSDQFRNCDECPRVRERTDDMNGWAALLRETPRFVGAVA